MTRTSKAWGWTALLGLALPLQAALAAETTERFDHRGSVGLLLGSGFAYKDQLISGVITNGLRFPLDLGGSVSIGHSGNEAVAHVVDTLGDASVHDFALSAGYRSYFGEEQLKTYLSLELAVHVAPVVTLGPRVGFGLQYDALPTFGLYLGAVADLGAARGIRFSAELTLGIQLRTYLLEG